MSKHLAQRVYMGSVIMEEAAKRADRLKMSLPCFGKHCNGVHPLPIPMFFEPVAEEFPGHVTYTFHRGIPIAQELPTELVKMIMNEESKAIANRIYGRTPVAV